MKRFAFAATVAADSTVTKVVDLLVELKGKVQSDLDAEAALMDEYSTWCDDESTKTSYAIKDEKRVVSELSATIEGESAKGEKFSSQVEELGPAIAGKQGQLADAETVRGDEHKAFLAKEKELVESEDMLRRAYGILKRSVTGGVSLAQGGAQLKEAVAAIGAIVSSAWIDPANAAKLKQVADDELSLAQQEPAEEEDKVMAPQARSSNYDSKSGSILSVIDNLREETAENLRKTRNAETKSRHAFELLKQSLDNEVSCMSAQVADAQTSKAAAAEALGAAQGDLKTSKETLAADQDYLKNTQNSCHVKAEEWSARQKQAAEEMTALDEAKEILATKVTVFVQVAASTKDDRARETVVSILRNLGHKYNSFGLLQAATSAQADPFGKVRGMVQDMIAKLESQAREEADHNEMCETELARNEKKKAKKTSSLKKHNTRFDGATSKIAGLTAQIEDLVQELKDMAAAVAEATKMRNTEHAENTKVVEENKESAAAVAEAIKVLREYYGPGSAEDESFLQAPAPQVSFAAPKAGGAHPIIGILETAESDFTKLFMETESDEAEASEAYKTFMQKSEVSKAKKETAIAGKKSEIETLKVAVSQVKDDIATTETELDAVAKSLAALHRECDSKAMSYEERKSRREAEIAGLQQALEVLSPEEAESLIQKSFLARK